MPGLPFDRVSSSSYFEYCTSLIAAASYTLLMRIVSNNARQQIHLTIMPRQTHIKHKFVSNWRPGHAVKKGTRDQIENLAHPLSSYQLKRQMGITGATKKKTNTLKRKIRTLVISPLSPFYTKTFLNSRILLNR